MVISGLPLHEVSPAVLTGCLRATPYLTKLKVERPYGWFTPDTIRQLTRRPTSESLGTCLVPEVEVLEFGDASIDSRLLIDMIESRWRDADGERTIPLLKEVRVELYQPALEDTSNNIIQGPVKFGVDTLIRLRKCRDEGMGISIIDVENGCEDLLKSDFT
jgi:hypothetical protein